ncbi:hypothetical protein EI989_05010 [Streptococcus suis]|nr:hypothetical protein EI985_04420 [Streptococcus suis]RRR41050.1 hypothetical protein EI989_05010 [Streptococcus suis]RRR60804.1 hypothetical protein EI991_09440 [Streptococcus suis]
MIRSDLECETRTNLPINYCAEMLTRTLRSETGLAQPSFYSSFRNRYLLHISTLTPFYNHIKIISQETSR